MKNQIAILALALSVSALPAAGVAADAYVTTGVNLRSGPDSSYPIVARLRAGSPVSLDGCVDGWEWCDVSNSDDRGWVSGAFLQQEYEGERLGIRSYGSRIGIPIISFEFGTYWNDHYRNRSWYEQREHWSHVRPRYRAFDERRGTHDRERDDSHEHAREDSHNYSHGDTRGSARSGDQATQWGSRGTAYSQPDRSADARARGAAVSEHHPYGEPSAPIASRSDDQTHRAGTANAQIPSRAANERAAEQDGARRDEAARRNPAPVAVAARPAVHVQSVTPAQNRSAAAKAADTAAKTREQERDDKDRR